MQVDEFKEKVKQVLNADIKFDGHVNRVINHVNENRQRSIVKWVEACKFGKEKAEACKNFRNLICFIYKSNDNKIRGILTKEKNSYFIELFLDKHKYYDRKRRYLGI